MRTPALVYTVGSMRLALAAALIAAAGCVDDPDPISIKALCDNGTVYPFFDTRQAPLPSGQRFALDWTCVENCDLAAHGLVKSAYLDTERNELVWFSDPDRAVNERTPADVVGGCWRTPVLARECRPSFYVCADGPGAVRAEIVWHVFSLGLDQRWIVTGDRM